MLLFTYMKLDALELNLLANSVMSYKESLVLNDDMFYIKLPVYMLPKSLA